MLFGQVGFDPAVSAILTEGVTGVATEMLIPLDVAGLAVTPARLDVITQVTTCPAVSVEEVKVELLVPTFNPFTFH